MHIISRLKIFGNWQVYFLVWIFMLPARYVYSQNEGALFMLPDNFQAQLLNPAYFNEEATILALPGLAGASLSNEANFKLTDIIYTNSSGQTVYDLGRFGEMGHSINWNSIHFSMPLLYVGIPTKKGVLSFHIKENINIATRFPINTIVWFDNGNLPEAYHNFQSGNIHFKMLGFYEAGFGYGAHLNEKLRFGVRGKILFGQMLVQFNKWYYSIETSTNGDKVTLSSQGRGIVSSPFPVIRDESGKFQNVETENALSNYLSVRNPGFAIDGGITVDIDKKRQFSVSINDLGLIYFKNNTWDLYQNSTYDFYGIDISNSVNSKIGNGYVFPFYLMTSVKDSIRNVFKPVSTPRKLFRGPSPKLYMHYQYKYATNFSLGITNRTIFQKSYLMNTTSLNALKEKGNFCFFGNITLHRLSSLTFGGGLQWNTAFTQFFVFTDNIIAIYHPAAQRSYALTFGVNFLFNKNKPEPEDRKTDYSRRGKISKYFPFYKEYQ